MTVERFERTGPLTTWVGKVYHSSQDDPTMGVYVTLVEVVGNHSEGDTTEVRVGTPLASNYVLSNIEVQSIVQLLTGRAARVGTQPTDQVDTVEGPCPRCWKTYDLTWP